MLGTQSINFNNYSIEVNNVSFGSNYNKEILHGISLSMAHAMLKTHRSLFLTRQLQKSIEALKLDKTIIMIAHSLKIISLADQILVIDHWRIVQKGTHEQLIDEPGIYADFVGGKKQTVDRKLKIL